MIGGVSLHHFHRDIWAFFSLRVDLLKCSVFTCTLPALFSPVPSSLRHPPHPHFTIFSQLTSFPSVPSLLSPSLVPVLFPHVLSLLLPFLFPLLVLLFQLYFHPSLLPFSPLLHSPLVASFFYSFSLLLFPCSLFPFIFLFAPPSSSLFLLPLPYFFLPLPSVLLVPSSLSPSFFLLSFALLLPSLLDWFMRAVLPLCYVCGFLHLFCSLPSLLPLALCPPFLEFAPPLSTVS